MLYLSIVLRQHFNKFFLYIFEPLINFFLNLKLNLFPLSFIHITRIVLNGETLCQQWLIRLQYFWLQCSYCVTNLLHLWSRCKEHLCWELLKNFLWSRWCWWWGYNFRWWYWWYCHNERDVLIDYCCWGDDWFDTLYLSVQL